MNISKNRLIQIIKEELQSEDTVGMPLYTADKEINTPPGGGAIEALRASIGSALSTLDHNSAVDVLMGVASDLGLHPPEEGAPSEYGAETGMGFVKTREDIERMIGDELMYLLKEINK